MSYTASAALQSAVYQRLTDHVPLVALVGTAIHDALPAGIPPALYVLIGPEDVTARTDTGGAVSVHDFTVSVVTEAAGFSIAKRAAAEICAALEDVALDAGHLVGLSFANARARRREAGQLREIVLRFRATVDIAA